MATENTSVKQDDTVLLPEMSFQLSEAYKTLRTNLIFTVAQSEKKAVAVTSSMPSEGKSTTCANLAIAMAENGMKVLLVDADMRRPTLHQKFKCANIKGLSSVLGGFDDLQTVIKKEISPGLDIITAGPIPPNPSELLGSKAMDELISSQCAVYDYVFIDTPPINVVSDAVILSGKVAGMVLVTRHKQSTYTELTKAVSRLEFSGATILGIVVNAIRESRGKYGGYKYKYKYEASS